MTTPDLATSSHIPSVLDGIRDSGLGPFLDLPLPQLPSAPQPAPPQPTAHEPTLGIPELLGPPPVTPAPTTGLPQVPALPANPTEALMQGLHLPALPGIDQLMQPMTSLLGGLGSGKFGSFDPTTIFESGSKLLEATMQSSQSAVKTLGSVWHGPAGEAAGQAGAKATDQGNQLGNQGHSIAQITQNAAATVQAANAHMMAIIQSFVAHAVAMGPVLFTPPGQTVLMASAAEHLTQATVLISETQVKLGGFIAEINAAGGLIAILSQSGINPADVLQGAQGVVQPMTDWAKEAVSSATSGSSIGSEAAGGAFGLPTAPSGADAGTTAASFGGGGGGGGIGGSLGGFGGTPEPPAAPAGPNAGQPGAGTAATAGAGMGTVPASAGGPSAGGTTGMTPAAHGARGGQENEHHRSVTPYQSSDYERNADVDNDFQLHALGDRETDLGLSYDDPFEGWDNR